MDASPATLRESPLRSRHLEFLERESARRQREVEAARGPEAVSRRPPPPEAEYLPYGPDDPAAIRCEILSRLDSVELEYAALRRGAAVVDANHRGTLVVHGPERRSFLNRMVTAELKDLEPGVARRGFWLNRKGRIEADLLLAEVGDRIVADLDIHQAAAAAASLSNYLISEECSVADESHRFHRLWLLGPLAAEALGAAIGPSAAVPPPGGAASLQIGGAACVAIASDLLGERGFEIAMPREAAAAVWDALVDAPLPGGRRVRPAGWQAFNVARIEAGTPLFNIDFGTDAIPNETGILRERVSFTKGCYLGQEVVARLEHLGRPKRMLVGLRVRGDALPIAGGQVFSKAGDGLGEVVGTITSSTVSPMLGAAPIALAMVRIAEAAAGTVVLVHADGIEAEAEVGPLRFVGPAAGASR
jgi:folate-binding protein YgfZ